MAGDTIYNDMMGALVDFFNGYLVPTLFTIAAGVFLVLGIINGIRWAKATTDEEKTKAKKAVIGLGIGLAISIISVWAIPYLMDFFMALFGGDALTAFEGNT